MVYVLIGHNGNDSDVPEATHIRGTVSVTDMRLISNDDDSEHSANDSIHVPSGGIKSPAINNNVGDLSLLGSSPGGGGGGMMSVSAMAATTSGNSSSNGSGGKKRGRNGEEIKDAIAPFSRASRKRPHVLRHMHTGIDREFGRIGGKVGGWF
ncbi:hypothetical protein DAPPUDRAFT_344270 [Daphnia pulex]|uniref:Uncharacterized protein n=1 Tax=Daphnia pulex TaxID=6669 RepID=E9I6V4_DAPPU|nr:hypothetical protein DAPPUDRAFT_344270 [Daphnia pulex]|eukprot:EFX60276.1 hypothetical protein DAPPUDRAFT_344270 [Daphnia pulex]